MRSDRSGVIGMPVKLAVCFLILGLMVPVVMESVQDADDEISLYDLRREAAGLRDAVQKAYFDQASVTVEVDLPSNQCLTVGGTGGEEYYIKLCADGTERDRIPLDGPTVPILGDEFAITGGAHVTVTATFDDDGRYGVAVSA